MHREETENENRTFIATTELYLKDPNPNKGRDTYLLP